MHSGDATMPFITEARSSIAAVSRCEAKTEAGKKHSLRHRHELEKRNELSKKSPEFNMLVVLALLQHKTCPRLDDI